MKEKLNHLKNYTKFLMVTEAIVYGNLEDIVMKNGIWYQKQGVHRMTNTMMKKLFMHGNVKL
ncbi:hypothetical protein [Staphylococcus ureilyticus]|uniref:Uncharacterized protein n=1 Tax=Staphylococcus ureilyticus TaxID=94138 RepID=A0AB34AK47_STAUR|nr:hypothetical protein [Staphylococcus ureilyticus]GEQ03429.1 hypothetical protein SCO02_18700 [Staphylococcus ureilyticus]